jgi:GDP-mannose pyrophosphatase NudK
MSGGGPKIVRRRVAHDGFNRMEVVTVETAGEGGKLDRREREVIDHGASAAVLPLDRERRMALLVRQWRAPSALSGGEPWILEAAAGMIDAGETPERTIEREAGEELGVRLRNLRRAGAVMPAPGTLTETIHLFLADYGPDDRFGPGGGSAAEGELMSVEEVALDDLFAAARAGDIRDAKTLILVQALMLQEG